MIDEIETDVEAVAAVPMIVVEQEVQDPHLPGGGFPQIEPDIVAHPQGTRSIRISLLGAVRHAMATMAHGTIDVHQFRDPYLDLVHALLHLHGEGMMHGYEDDGLPSVDPHLPPRGDGLHIGQRSMLGMGDVKVGIAMIFEEAPLQLLKLLAHLGLENIVEGNPLLDRCHVVLHRRHLD